MLGIAERVHFGVGQQRQVPSSVDLVTKLVSASDRCHRYSNWRIIGARSKIATDRLIKCFFSYCVTIGSACVCLPLTGRRRVITGKSLNELFK